MTEQNPPPGWYPAPHDPANLDRYWDGTEWSQQVREAHETGYVAQVRSLPLWIKLVIPAFTVAVILGTHAGVSGGSIQTVQQAAVTFENYELSKGAAGPLHLVKCTPSQEVFSCSGVEYKGKTVPLSRNLSATVESNGSVTAERSDPALPAGRIRRY